MKNSFIVGWWSAGITSAVACKMALELYENVELYYIGINSAHKDNIRFKADCEKWYGKEIHTLQSTEFKNQFEVIEKVRAVNTPFGAPCTQRLKKDAASLKRDNSFILSKSNLIILNQVWGYEYELTQINRAIRHGQQYPYTKPLFPLIEKGLNKNECAGILMSAGIEIPEMYKLGFNNNNCIGCVKGGMGYWNQIRVHFPETFERMAKLERVIGHSCINGIFLDELEPDAGRMTKEIMPNCGLICDIDFADLPDRNLEDVISGKKTIYEAIANKKVA